jgi:hypothetical protein
LTSQSNIGRFEPGRASRFSLLPVVLVESALSV